jgi:hypothetical protein
LINKTGAREQGKLEEIKESRRGNQFDEKKGKTYTRVKHGKERRKESLRTLMPT